MPLKSLHDHDDHGGLARDLDALSKRVDRRRALGVFAGFGAFTLLGCGSSDPIVGGDAGTDSSAGTDTGATADLGTPASCTTIPTETGGPYPGDGSNSVNGSVVNVLTRSGIVRSDIRPSFGAATGTATGVTLTVRLRILSASGCAALAGAAVYLWHCDSTGNYSLYSAGVTDENYLRGVQVADASGVVTFTTVFPGCYPGRMPHIHFEVFRNMAAATASTNAVKTSQLALPTDVCAQVYATPGYAAGVANLAATSFAQDMVFSDGYATQLASITGDVVGGFVAALDVTV